MPEHTGSADIEKALEFLEDSTLTTSSSRCQNYLAIQSALESGCDVTECAVQRLLVVCIHDLKEDMKYAVNTLNIISSVLTKKKGLPSPELLSSALAVLHIIKTTASINKVQALQTLCFNTLLLYPDVTYIELVANHNDEIREIFDLYFAQGISVNLKLLPFNILHKILRTLPSELKTTYIKRNLGIWFLKVIPTIMSLVTSHSEMMTRALDVMEMLTEDLEKIDYTNNTEWQTVLENIYIPERYPEIMKSLLRTGRDCWYRLWIVFVRLLKEQITMNRSKVGSPINSMLPVVEIAFKMDVANRCHAFKCWSVLTDNFSKELNESFINKRIKLLIIPLKSNNAKVEETALAKFESWWHLIRKFGIKDSKMFELIFVPFLHFCFGDPKNSSEKTIMIPGQLSMKMKRQCVEALVEVSGHVDCDGGCVSLPHLTQTILTPKLLSDYLLEWLHGLKSIIKIVSSESYGSENEHATENIKCVWKSFLHNCLKFKEEHKKFVVRELLYLLSQLFQECTMVEGVEKVIFNVLLPSLFDSPQLKSLVGSKDNPKDVMGPLHRILILVLKTPFYQFYPSSESEISVSKLRAMTDALFDKSQCSSKDSIDWLINELPKNDNGLLMWTALMESMMKANIELDQNVLDKMIMWPLTRMDHFQNVQYQASVWYSAYNSMKPKLSPNITEDISISLKNTKCTSSRLLALYALLQVIRELLERNNNADCDIEAEMLVNILSKIRKYESVITVIPVIVECLVLMLTQVNGENRASLAEFALTAANSTMKLIIQATRSSKNEELHTDMVKLLKIINELFKKDGFAKLKSIVLNQIIVCSTSFTQQSVKDITLTILKTILSRSKETEVPLYSMVQNAIAALEKQENNSEKNKFTTPKATSAKKTKKKEPSIINTVVENGEEYVVVKSNWKFNPKKLTENQKEKFLKKSEIPALYQDLSQSQDEFRLNPWKTDSQDASTTTNSNSDSKSMSKPCDDDDSTILKKMPSTDIVPKIMENIFSENMIVDPSNNKNDKTANENIESNNKSPKSSKTFSLSTSKQAKSPRVALKDRVFQNVRNLIEKSSASPERKLTKELNQTITDNLNKTPTSKVIKDNVANSAPPKLSADRPSRLKRKPKKYEADFEELTLNKKRLCQATNIESKKELDSEQLIDEPKSSSEEFSTIDKISIDQPSVNEITNENITPENNIIKEDTNNILNNDIIVIEDNDDVEITTTEKSIKTIEKSKATDENKEIIEQNNFSEDTTSKTNTKNKDKDVTPLPENKHSDKTKSSTKKSTKKSRIEKELAIDTVEGHPFLQITDKRATRKSLVGNTTSTRRKALSEKLNKLSQSDTKIPKKLVRKEGLAKELFGSTNSLDNVDIDNNSSFTDSLPMSEDYIESSQDTSITTISVKSNKSVGKKNPRIVLTNLQGLVKTNKKTSSSQSLLQNSTDASKNILKCNDDDDIEFSQNKSIPENNLTDLTSEMNTEPMTENVIADSDVIIITDDIETVQMISGDTGESDTQCTANADTQPNDVDECTEAPTEDCTKQVTGQEIEVIESDTQCTANADTLSMDPNHFVETQDCMEVDKPSVPQVEEATSTTCDTTAENDTEDGPSSPFNDEEQRNKDFLNNTLEISPIKSMSPVPDPKSPENSNDYVVIKLSSPVQINGEPFEKSCSPEIFTEDKISPDKRNQSPPRAEAPVNSTSPTSSLSLKKNRPQVRSGGRAAQMLGLCVPDSMQTLKSNDRMTEVDEPKKTFSTPARRNLLILNNCGENIESNAQENGEGNSAFLKFKRTLPSADSSPSVPILKRKLAEMCDDATASPASKRKRVSFHDPPVSTTMSVQKYIEPLGTRSPQSSVLKKLERQTRANPTMKSPKKLEILFKLDTALVTTVECFEENTPLCSDDVDMSSLEQTPAAEIVKTSDLNDTEPICPELVDCKNPISDIASELSSPAMKNLLLQELEDKIKTIGDLARLSELEINRLCIKAPKVKVAKKVLSEYTAKQIESKKDDVDNVTLEMVEPDVVEVTPRELTDIKVQKEKPILIDQDMQTDANFVEAETQTFKNLNISRLVQTDESGSKSTKDIIKTCLLERSDFVEELSNNLDDDSKMRMLDTVPLEPLCDTLKNKITNNAESRLVIESVLNKQKEFDPQSSTNSLSFLQDFICERYGSSDLILFCSNLLKTLHDKTT